MHRPDNANLLRYAGIAAQVLVGVVAVAVASVLVLPQLLGWDVVTVLSGSMAPTYPTDSVLAIESVDPADIDEGDVIAFKPEPDAVMITHRVVSVDETPDGLSFVTKGDANEDPDSRPVAAASVHGRVAFGVPVLGKLIRVAHTPLGFFMLLVLPALLVIVHEGRSIQRALREDRQENGPAPVAAAPRAAPTTPLQPAPAWERQLLLLTVAADWANRREVLDLAVLSGGSLVSVGHDWMVFSLVAEPFEVSAFELLLGRFGVLSSERTVVLTASIPAVDPLARDSDPGAPSGASDDGPDFERIIAGGFGEMADPLSPRRDGT